MTAIKICGITRVEDALLAAEAGAHAIGLVLWPGSPRAVDAPRARAIVQELPPFVAPVAVLVSPSFDDVRRVVEEVGVRVVQVHGPLELAPLLAGPWHVVRAMPGPDGAAALADVDARATLLLDAHDPVRHGGTGTTIDWAVAATLAATRRMVLAGGLHADNVGEAIRRVRPHAVDVASGVESSPGTKDAVKVRAFVAQVREVDAAGRARVP